MATTEEYIESLNRDKDTLVTNLKAKGVGADNTETFTTLAPKVLNVPGVEDYILNKSLNSSDNFKDIKCFFKKLPDLDLSNNNSNLLEFCASCYNLEETSNIILPLNGNIASFFYFCRSLKKVKLFDTSTVINIYRMFYGCKSLQEIPAFNFSNCEACDGFAGRCSVLKTIGKLNLSKIQWNASSMLEDCPNLENIGGFVDYGKSFRANASINDMLFTINLTASPKVTHDSLMNIINTIFDRKSIGANPQMLNFGTTNLAKLTPEEIAIATNKGWNVS